MKLYHYTCADHAPVIERRRCLVPNRHQLMPHFEPLVHLTDLAEPDRMALGLTSQILECDRTEFRVTVSYDYAEHWPRFARRIPRSVREELEGAPGAMPMHWYVVVDQIVPILSIEAVAHA